MTQPEHQPSLLGCKIFANDLVHARAHDESRNENFHHVLLLTTTNRAAKGLVGWLVGWIFYFTSLIKRAHVPNLMMVMG